jgi:hypothetical protein
MTFSSAVDSDNSDETKSTWSEAGSDTVRTGSCTSFSYGLPKILGSGTGSTYQGVQFVVSEEALLEFDKTVTLV